jgi:hypothetical protein
MSELLFAPWVEPIARRYRERREELIAFSRALPRQAWTLTAHESGWSCKDLLAHVAGDTGQNLHVALRAIIDGRAIPAALFEDFDERNERDVEERRSHSVAELIDELRAAADETQRLLSLLSDDDEHRREAGLRGTLAEALPALGEHDAMHLDQLRAATSQAAGMAMKATK